MAQPLKSTRQLSTGLPASRWWTVKRLVQVYCQTKFKFARLPNEIQFAGSAAIDLAFVAAGSADAFFHFGGLHCWDVAAGALLVSSTLRSFSVKAVLYKLFHSILDQIISR